MKIEIVVTETSAIVKADGSKMLEVSDLGTGVKVQSTGCLPVYVATAEVLVSAQSAAFQILKLLRAASE
jgi:hypothetical protein